MKSISFKIVLSYLFAGILWITVSDIFVFFTEGSKSGPIMLIGTVSGLLFLLVTGVVLFKLINYHYHQLQQSEKKYRTYFEDNPTPMWVYNRKTLRFITVNNAAVFNYGYTKEEFYNMSILDIRPAEDAHKVIASANDFETPYKNSGTWHHKRKDGSDIYAHITSHLTITSHEPHVMIMATDITKRLQTETQLQQANEELKKQNDMLREISWSQSHNVRKPLASILGLLSVIRLSKNQLDKDVCINYIEVSASELDLMLYNINEQINNAAYTDEPHLKPERPPLIGVSQISHPTSPSWQ